MVVSAPDNEALVVMGKSLEFTAPDDTDTSSCKVTSPLLSNCCMQSCSFVQRAEGAMTASSDVGNGAPRDEQPEKGQEERLWGINSLVNIVLVNPVPFGVGCCVTVLILTLFSILMRKGGASRGRQFV